VIQVKTSDGETYEFERGSLTVGESGFTFKYTGGYILFPFHNVIWIKHECDDSTGATQ